MSLGNRSEAALPRRVPAFPCADTGGFNCAFRARTTVFLYQTDRAPLDISALSLALQHLANSEVAALSAGWVLNAKAVAQEAVASRTLLVGDRKIRSSRQNSATGDSQANRLR